MPGFDSFWSTAGPGLLDFGVNYLKRREADKTARNVQQQVKGPLYDQNIGLAGSILKNTNLDPTSGARSNYQDYLDLTAQGDLQAEQDLMRRLQAQGKGGLASYGAIGGTNPTPGQPINPQLAALYAAREGAKQRAAIESKRTAQEDIDRNLNRAGALESRANSSLATRSSPNVQQVLAPPRKNDLTPWLSAGATLLKDPTLRSGLFDAIGGGLNMLGDLGRSGAANFGIGGWDLFGPNDYSADFGLDDWNW